MDDALRAVWGSTSDIEIVQEVRETHKKPAAPSCGNVALCEREHVLWLGKEARRCAQTSSLGVVVDWCFNGSV